MSHLTKLPDWEFIPDAKRLSIADDTWDKNDCGLSVTTFTRISQITVYLDSGYSYQLSQHGISLNPIRNLTIFLFDLKAGTILASKTNNNCI